MKVLVLGDSLPAPRPRRGLPLETTWPALLREHTPELDVWQRARPRACSIDVLAEFKLFTESLDRFDTVIVQTGIVDCVPRPYPRWFIKIFEIFASFEQLRAFDRAAHQRFLWAWGRPWVPAAEYKANLAQLIREATSANPNLKVVLIPIAPPTRRMLTEFRGIEVIVARYNQILRELAVEHGDAVRTLDSFSGQDPLALTLDDGHHLTALGHELIAADIIGQLPAESRPPMALAI